MKFVLAGFRQNGNVRVYLFQGIGADRRTRTEFSVGVDLTLLHKHRIPLQEVPLLCCRSLASRIGCEQLAERDFVLSEAEMLAHFEQLARDRAGDQADRTSKPLSPGKSQNSPLPIDFPNGRSGIGLGSRVGLSLAQS
jgi:hypothetical protein